MAKRKNTQRADGRYSVQVYIGTVDGKRKYKTVYGYSQKEADEKARLVKMSLLKGIDVSAEYDTFGKWANLWLEYKKNNVSNSQHEVYKASLKHLKPIFNLPISKVKHLDIQKIINDLSRNNPNTNKPASKRTLSSIKQTVNQVYKLAISNRVVEYNPADAIFIPYISNNKKARALTKEEQQWILNTEHRAKLPAMIMMFAGLRKGELIPLTWNDIDLTRKTITVNKSVEKIDNRYLVKPTAKTKSSIRTISIPNILVDYLKNIKKDGLLVCPNTTGQIHTPSSFKSMWNSYLKELNLKYGDFSSFENIPKSKFNPKGIPFVIPKINPHWLRHTFATILYFAGVDVLTAKEQLGHSNINITLDIYTHLNDEYKNTNMNKVDIYLAQ